MFFIRERLYHGMIDRLRRKEKGSIAPDPGRDFLVLVVLVVFSLFYTGHFLDLSGMKDSVYKALSHWYEMHKIQRMGGPYYYYMPLIALYELPSLYSDYLECSIMVSRIAARAGKKKNSLISTAHLLDNLLT